MSCLTPSTQHYIRLPPPSAYPSWLLLPYAVHRTGPFLIFPQTLGKGRTQTEVTFSTCYWQSYPDSLQHYWGCHRPRMNTPSYPFKGPHVVGKHGLNTRARTMSQRCAIRRHPPHLCRTQQMTRGCSGMELSWKTQTQETLGVSKGFKKKSN
ncbi:unnamed protein product [Caretta caretta]